MVQQFCCYLYTFFVIFLSNFVLIYGSNNFTLKDKKNNYWQQSLNDSQIVKGHLTKNVNIPCKISKVLNNNILIWLIIFLRLIR